MEKFRKYDRARVAPGSEGLERFWGKEVILKTLEEPSDSNRSIGSGFDNGDDGARWWYVLCEELGEYKKVHEADLEPIQ